jgi:hypothetical protein
MAVAKYQQRCAQCKKNMVQMFSRKQYPICTQCQMKQLDQEIENPEYKKMFDIPKEFYAQSYFLRSIKENCIRFGSLSERQVEAFKRTVEEMKNPKPKMEEEKGEKVAESVDTPAKRKKGPIRTKRD